MSEEPRVLIVDDAANWRRTLAAVTEDLGHEVSAAENLEEGLRALRQKHYRLAIVDVRLVEADRTDTSGLTLVKEAWEQHLVDGFILVSVHEVAGLVLAALGDAIPYEFFPKRVVESPVFPEAIEKFWRLACHHRLHLADLHLGGRGDANNFNPEYRSGDPCWPTWTSVRLQSLRPDFIAITGDLAAFWKRARDGPGRKSRPEARVWAGSGNFSTSCSRSRASGATGYFLFPAITM